MRPGIVYPILIKIGRPLFSKLKYFLRNDVEIKSIEEV